MAWFDSDCRRAFELKQSAYHRWCRNRTAVNWDLFCQARGTANRLCDCEGSLLCYLPSESLMIVPLLMPGGTLKGHVFGAESDVPPLCSPGVVLISDPAAKAELLSAWFDSKQSRDITLLSCRRPVILDRPSVVLLSESVRLSGTCWILILMVVWTRQVASLCFFRRLLMFLPRN